MPGIEQLFLTARKWALLREGICAFTVSRQRFECHSWTIGGLLILTWDLIHCFTTTER